MNNKFPITDPKIINELITVKCTFTITGKNKDNIKFDNGIYPASYFITSIEEIKDESIIVECINKDFKYHDDLKK
jgi:hypothetical protein